MPGLTSLAALAGRWRLDRHIAHSDGSINRFEGEAQFRRSGPRLIHEETGRLIVGNQALTATRRYVWEQRGKSLHIYFDDMRPFHSLPLGAETCETVHLCDPDRYAVAYDFRDWPRWSAVWSVEGPRKAYVMTSHFAPIRGPAA